MIPETTVSPLAAARRGLLRVGEVRSTTLLLGAGALHVLFALVLQLLGRAGAVPLLAGRGGFSPALAHDASIFQFNSEYLVNTLRHEGLTAWLAMPAPLHAKLYSLCFALTSPLLGFTVLGAEPLNVLCYVVTLTLVFQLAATLGGRRAGLLAAALVALWPSYLLLSAQLLRDPLFIVALLALCRVCVGWLAADRGAVRGALEGLLGGLSVLALWLMRWDMQELIAGVAVLGVLMLLWRQLRSRRALFGNLLGGALLLALTVAAPRLAEASRPLGLFPHRAPGLAVAPLGPVVPTRCEPRRPWTCVHDAVERVAWRAGFLREKFLRKYGQAGSNIDADVRLGGAADLARYLPRAVAIGLFAPFPRSWLGSGSHVGRSGRLLSGLEMLAFYGAELLALLGLLRRPALPALFLGLVVLGGCAALGAAVLNLGTLYRIRSGFFMLVLALAASAACSRTRTGRWWAPRRGTPGSAA